MIQRGKHDGGTELRALLSLHSKPLSVSIFSHLSSQPLVLKLQESPFPPIFSLCLPREAVNRHTNSSLNVLSSVTALWSRSHPASLPLHHSFVWGRKDAAAAVVGGEKQPAPHQRHICQLGGGYRLCTHHIMDTEPGPVRPYRSPRSKLSRTMIHLWGSRWGSSPSPSTCVINL